LHVKSENLTCWLVAQHHSQLQAAISGTTGKHGVVVHEAAGKKSQKKYRPVHCPVREKNELVGIEIGEL